MDIWFKQYSSGFFIVIRFERLQKSWGNYWDMKLISNAQADFRRCKWVNYGSFGAMVGDVLVMLKLIFCNANGWIVEVWCEYYRFGVGKQWDVLCYLVMRKLILSSANG
ncbi:unnamed protein product [Dovyalis caffra]|uniref:Uncharacterized protein n=1 Tax=Dovyalis caffra TaxID=77055 RepID=A0AAV1S1U0_9ROSI|nr:unnamed protein product [Dovyalis caffra]